MARVPLLFFIGGFLGAGKTTAIVGLAKMFAKRGLKTAVITNDQAEGLVDTVFLAGTGLPAEEVAGSCFCCNFVGLSNSILHTVETADPDIILAEPVGSCADIVATVIRPMREHLSHKISVAAYSVLVEPDRWAELANDEPDSLASMKFLFDKQLLEADFIVINKIDTLSEEQKKDLEEETKDFYPDAQVVSISAREDTNVDKWLELVCASSPGEHWLKDMDYDEYADAEAEMGWLNAQMSLKFWESVDGTSVAKHLTEELMTRIGERNGRIGHLKLLATSKEGSVKSGVTRVGSEVSLDGSFDGPVTELAVIVNIRATVSPDYLSDIVNSTVNLFAKDTGVEVDISYLNTFRPAAPNPTYRYNS